MIKIELTNSEAELFKKFAQYQNDWEKVFHIRGGSATLHFDDVGKIRQIEYKYREKPKGLTNLI